MSFLNIGKAIVVGITTHDLGELHQQLRLCGWQLEDHHHGVGYRYGHEQCQLGGRLIGIEYGQGIKLQIRKKYRMRSDCDPDGSKYFGQDYDRHVDEIYRNMLQQENEPELRVFPDYLTVLQMQVPDITETMRQYLIDYVMQIDDIFFGELGQHEPL